MGNGASTFEHAKPKKGIRFGRVKGKGSNSRNILLAFRQGRQLGASDIEDADTSRKDHQVNAAQSLLAAINLGIYTDAFLLAGYADCDAAVIARLTAADLARVQTLSKIPILPQHQQLILEGSRQLGESLGILPASTDDLVTVTDTTAGTAALVPASNAACGAGTAAAEPTAAADPAALLLPVSFCASDSKDGSSHVRPPHSADTSNQQHQRLRQRQLLLQQSQEPYAPCPLMNPFLAPNNTCSKDKQGGGVADAAWALSPPDNTDPATQPGSTAHMAGSSSSNHYSAFECNKSHPSSYATARSASRGSISGSEHDNNRPSSSSSSCKSQQAAAAKHPAAAAAAAPASTAVAAVAAATAATAAPAASPPRVFQSRRAAWNAGTRVGLGSAAAAAAAAAGPDSSAAACSGVQKRDTARQAGSSNIPDSSSADRKQQLGNEATGAANNQQNGTPHTNPSCLASSSTAEGAPSAGADTAGAPSAVPGTDTAAKSSELERPSSSSSNRSQKAASVAAAAASALTQAAMHLDRVALSERVMQQQRQQHALELQQQQELLTATAARDTCSGPAAAQAAGASEVKQPAGLLPGLSEIEPAEAETAQAPSGQEQEHHAETAATDGRTLCAPHHHSEPSFAQGLTEVKTQHQAGTEAGAAAEASWLDDSEREMGMGRPNPFLDSAIDTQRPSTAAPAAHGVHASTARPQTAAPAFGPHFLGSMAPPASEAGGGGPLTASRSQLLRQSRNFGGKPILSSPATTAAAAARLTGKKHSGSGRTWDNLPGAVAAASYAATASLRTNPLPALAAVASGQQKRMHAVDPEPGVLTLKASQLPHRAVSESGFSTRSSYSWRHPGLRAEESTATAAMAMQQLARQQACNQELIYRLLQVPGAAAAVPATEPSHVPGQGLPACSVAQGASGLLQPELSTVSSVLGPSTSVFVLQQQPMHAQYDSNSASFLGSVAVEDLGRSAVQFSTVQLPAAGATETVLLQQQPQQQQQHPQPQLLLLRSDCAAAAPSALVQIPPSALQYSEPLPQLSGVLHQPQQQQQLQQQAWQLQHSGSIRARAVHASGRQPAGVTGLLLQPQQHHQAHGLAVPVTLQHSPYSGSVTVIPTGPQDASAAVIHGGVHQVLQPYGHECLLQQQRSSVSVASSAAGSVLAGLTGTRSCLELGSRAGDLNVLQNIVQRAKAKASAAVARKHQQGAQLQQQEQDSTPKTPVLGSRLLDMLAEGKQLKGAAAMLVGKPRHAVYPAAPTAQPTAAVTAAYGIPGSVPSSNPAAAKEVAEKPSNSNGPEAAALGRAPDRQDPGTGGSLTAAVRDGDRVLKMLQEYKELSELDKAVKSRMMQLLHTASVPGAAAAAGGSAAAAARAESAGQADAAAGAARADVLLRSYGGAGHTGSRSSSARLPVLSEVSNEQQDVPGGPSSSILQQPQGGNNCAGVTEPAYGYANPFLEQPWPDTAGAGAAAAVSVDAPGNRYSFVDQTTAGLPQRQQHRSSPSKAQQQHTLLQHVDQQLKLQGSPDRRVQVSCPAGNTSSAEWDAQGTTAAKRKAARQLWERRQTVKATAIAPGAGTAAAAPDIGRWVHAPDTHPSAVAALVAAVAGGQPYQAAGSIAPHGPSHAS